MVDKGGKIGHELMEACVVLRRLFFQYASIRATILIFWSELTVLSSLKMSFQFPVFIRIPRMHGVQIWLS